MFVPHPAKLTPDDFDYGALMDRNGQRAPSSQTHSSTATQSWACGPWSQMPSQSWQGHWQYYGWDIRKTTKWDPSEHHNGRWLLGTKGPFTGDTADIIVQHHDTHTTFTQSNLSVSLADVNLSFPAWANVPENLSLHRRAQSKSQFIAQ